MKGIIRLHIDGVLKDTLEYHSKGVLKGLLKLIEDMKRESDRECMKNGMKPPKYMVTVRPEATDEPVPVEATVSKRPIPVEIFERPKAEYSNKGYQSILDQYS